MHFIDDQQLAQQACCAQVRVPGADGRQESLIDGANSDGRCEISLGPLGSHSRRASMLGAEFAIAVGIVKADLLFRSRRRQSPPAKSPPLRASPRRRAADFPARRNSSWLPPWREAGARPRAWAAQSTIRPPRRVRRDEETATEPPRSYLARARLPQQPSGRRILRQLAGRVVELATERLSEGCRVRRRTCPTGRGQCANWRSA